MGLHHMRSELLSRVEHLAAFLTSERTIRIYQQIFAIIDDAAWTARLFRFDFGVGEHVSLE